MDILKAEIERKRKQISKANVVVRHPEQTAEYIYNYWFIFSRYTIFKFQPENKKYFKRGELSAKQQEEYWQKHKRMKYQEPQVSPSTSSKQKDISSESKSENNKSELDVTSTKPTLSRKEVCALRQKFHLSIINYPLPIEQQLVGMFECVLKLIPVSIFRWSDG